MLTAVVVALGFWSAVVADPQAQEPADTAKVAEAPVAEARPDPAALAKYNELKEKTRNTADDQWKLAIWCEQNGLEAEAFAHFSNVVKLDPKRVAAWRKLGYKKHHGQWMTDQQIQEEEDQKKADQVWAPKLAKLHRQYHEQRTRAQAEDDLAKIEDPRAAIGVFREFGTRGPGDQSLAIQVLGQIKGQNASKCLALLAVYGASAEVRRRATETLKGRDSEEFVDLLISLLTDPLKYEVKPVGGPGSPGVLFVEGEKFNVRRLYAAPLPPAVQLQPFDILSYDEYGLPVITRPGPALGSFGGAAATTARAKPNLAAASAPFRQAGVPVPSGALQSISANPTSSFPTRVAAQIPVGQNMIAARQAAANAQQQLEGDLKQIEKINEVRSRFNSTVASILKETTSEEPGDDARAWKKWLAERKGYNPKAEKPKPTFNQLIATNQPPFFMRLIAAAMPGPPSH